MRTKVSILIIALFLCVAARSPAQEEVEATRLEASKLTKKDIPDLRQRAESGDAKAQLLLGKAYALKFGVKHDYKEAMKWYLKSAEQGNRVAQHAVCNNYRFGHGVRKDADTAIEWCRRAADQGLPEAQGMLDALFGSKENYSEAAVWARKAAEQGYFAAQISLAHHYAFGQGVPQDDVTAYMWLLLALAAQCGEPPQLCVEKDPEAGDIAEQGRNGVGAKLSAHQIAEARGRASEWLKAHQKEPLPAEESEAKTANFLVSHQHAKAAFLVPGRPGMSRDYCFGRLRIEQGVIRYSSRRGNDVFEIPIPQVKEVRKLNDFAIGDFAVLIRMETGKKFTLFVINERFEDQDPHALFEALNKAMGQN